MPALENSEQKCKCNLQLMDNTGRHSHPSISKADKTHQFVMSSAFLKEDSNPFLDLSKKKRQKIKLFRFLIAFMWISESYFSSDPTDIDSVYCLHLVLAQHAVPVLMHL